MTKAQSVLQFSTQSEAIIRVPALKFSASTALAELKTIGVNCRTAISAAGLATWADNLSGAVLLLGVNEGLRGLLYERYCAQFELTPDSGKLPQAQAHLLVDLWGRILAARVLLQQIFENSANYKEKQRPAITDSLRESLCNIHFELLKLLALTGVSSEYAGLSVGLLELFGAQEEPEYSQIQPVWLEP